MLLTNRNTGKATDQNAIPVPGWRAEGVEQGLKRVVVASLFVALFRPFGRAKLSSSLATARLPRVDYAALTGFADFCTENSIREACSGFAERFYSFTIMTGLASSSAAACHGLLVNRSAKTCGIWKILAHKRRSPCLFMAFVRFVFIQRSGRRIQV